MPISRRKERSVIAAAISLYNFTLNFLIIFLLLLFGFRSVCCRKLIDIYILPHFFLCRTIFSTKKQLAFSLQLQIAAEQNYPGFTRRIYLKAYRYSLHMLPKSLLIEAGAQTNTVEEMRNAMEVLASLLHRVLTEGA